MSWNDTASTVVELQNALRLLNSLQSPTVPSVPLSPSAVLLWLIAHLPPDWDITFCYISQVGYNIVMSQSGLQLSNLSLKAGRAWSNLVGAAPNSHQFRPPLSLLISQLHESRAPAFQHRFCDLRSVCPCPPRVAQPHPAQRPSGVALPHVSRKPPDALLTF